MELAKFESIKNNELIWIDVPNPDGGKMQSLGRMYPFHELNLDDCLSKTQIQKIDRYPDHIFIILHFPILEDQNVAKTSQLAIFMGSGYLVSVHQDDLKPLTELFNMCKEDDKERQELMGRSSGYLFHSIVDALVDDLVNIARMVKGNMADIEDAVFDERVSASKEISYLRRQIMALRRIAVPLQATLLEFGNRDIQRFSSEEDLVPYFDDVKDHVERAIRILDETRDTIEIFKDTDFMHGMEKSNKILAVLTIIFTLSIPATIISSFYGMNVSVPGGAGAWSFLGAYTAFIVVASISSAAALIMLWYFHRIEWI